MASDRFKPEEIIAKLRQSWMTEVGYKHLLGPRMQ
jgi:hypothetical protein